MDTFVSDVREMRKAQKAYFKSKLHSDLIRAKELERKVDQALAEMEAGPQKEDPDQQMGLFPGELR